MLGSCQLARRGGLTSPGFCQNQVCAGGYHAQCVGCSGCKYWEVEPGNEDSEKFMNRNPRCSKLKKVCQKLGDGQEVRKEDLQVGPYRCLQSSSMGYFIPTKCMQR